MDGVANSLAHQRARQPSITLGSPGLAGEYREQNLARADIGNAQKPWPERIVLGAWLAAVGTCQGSARRATAERPKTAIRQRNQPYLRDSGPKLNIAAALCRRGAAAVVAARVSASSKRGSRELIVGKHLYLNPALAA